MEKLSEGSIEFVVVRLKDRISLVTDLSPYSPTFTVRYRDALDTDPPLYDNEPASADGLDVKCLIDTTGWLKGIYKLWVKIMVSPETPIFGPFEFSVT